MNVLYVTSYDSAGQQFNGYQLHRALKQLGHRSYMAVMKRFLDEPEIIQLGGPLLRFMNLVAARLERMLSLRSVFPVLSLDLYRQPYYKQADIVHLELIQAWQFFSLFNLPFMSRQHPLILTVHDPWFLSGHCVHPLGCERWMEGCGRCPDLGVTFPIRFDTTSLAWKIKNWIMHNSTMTLIVASRWMYERVKRSPILSHLPCHVIPFGVDTSQFCPRDKAKARAHFGIPQDARVIAFRSVPFSRNFKGTEYLEKALSLIQTSSRPYLVTFEGVGGLESIRNKFRFVELDWVSDRKSLADALIAADMFVMPSIAESFGMMAVESMACGTPVIAFDGTALTGVIRAPEIGVAVPYKDHVALAAAIEKLLEDRELLMTKSEKGLQLVQEEYTLERCVARHLELYESLLSSN